MDSAERWRAKKTSITQRNVDKELLRIKSLGVVSVLNRTFEDEPRGRSRSTSHSDEYLKELEVFRLENEHQRELLGLQDVLIQQLTGEIEYLVENNSLHAIQKDLEELGSSKQQCEDEMQRLKKSLEDSEIKIDCMEEIANELKQRQKHCLDDTLRQTYEDQQESMRQTYEKEQETTRQEYERQQESMKQEYEDQLKTMSAKMEMMARQLKEKEEVVSRLSMSLSRSSTMSERNEEDDQSTTSSSRKRRSYIARWKGNSLPPASPPPSTPLPPVPSDRRRSSASRLPVIAHKHMSVDAVGGPQSFSSIYEQEMCYKEFTDQLQERLSMSKEIDDLSVWRPSDYDEIQRKIESEDWLEDQQKVAFWKGMKKKLKV